MSAIKPLQIDIVSDVVCPWCYIGKRRIENAIALAADVPVHVNWRPFFLNPWIPPEGIDRSTYLETKFGSADAMGKSAEMKQKLMELYFRDGGDLTQTETLVQAAADIGLDADDVRRRLATDEAVERISAQAKEASDKGISGVPTYVFAQKYAVSGAQDPEKLARAIRQVSAEINAQAAE